MATWRLIGFGLFGDHPSGMRPFDVRVAVEPRPEPAQEFVALIRSLPRGLTMIYIGEREG